MILAYVSAQSLFFCLLLGNLQSGIFIILNVNFHCFLVDAYLDRANRQPPELIADGLRMTFKNYAKAVLIVALQRGNARLARLFSRRLRVHRMLPELRPSPGTSPPSPATLHPPPGGFCPQAS